MRTPDGDIPIEELRTGDRVVTYRHSIKTIKELFVGTIVNDGSSLRTTVYSHENGLRLTGEHCLLLESPSDELLIRTKELLGRNSVIDGLSLVPSAVLGGFTKTVDGLEYTVYNMTLSGGDPIQAYGVYAHGLLCETLSPMAFRGRFGRVTDTNEFDNP